MTEKLDLQSGEQFLPFARSVIKKLRATGLSHASQKYVVGDATITARIAGEHSYIRIEGGTSGDYLVLPTDFAHPSGVTLVGGMTVPAVAKLTVSKDLKIEVTEHSPLLAGPTDWRGNKGDCVTYDNGFVTRYWIDRLRDSTIDSALPGIFVNGVAVSTGAKKVVGACLTSFTSGELSERRAVIIVVESGQYVAYTKASSGWVEAGRLSLSGITISPTVGVVGRPIAEAKDPWFFSPNGKNGISLASGDGTNKVKVLRCVLSATIDGEVLTPTCSFSIGEEVGTYATVTNSVAAAPVVTLGPFVLSESYSGGTPPTAYSGTLNQYYLLRSQSGDTLTGSSGAASSRVLGADFQPDGSERLLYLDQTSLTGQKNTTSYKSVIDAGNGGSGTGYSSPEAIAAAASIAANYHTIVASNTELASHSGDYFITETVRIHNGTETIHEWESKFSRGWASQANFGAPITYSYPANDGKNTSTRCVVHGVDLRSRSILVEEVVQTFIEDRSYTPPSFTAFSGYRKFTGKITSDIKFLTYGSTRISIPGPEAATITFSSRGPASTGIFSWGFDAILVGGGPDLGEAVLTRYWGISELRVPDVAELSGTFSSAAAGQYVVSATNERGALPAFLTGESPVVAFTRTATNEVRVMDKTTNASPTEMAKLPLFSTTLSDKFSINPVRAV